MRKSNLSGWIDAHAAGLCVAITMLAAVLRLYQVGARSVWFDEAIQILIARAPLAQTQAVSLSWFYAHPPLYSWLLHLTLNLGESEWIWRLPSVLAGTLAVFAAYHLFRLWVDASTALFSQLLLALAPAQIYFSQEVNQYAFMVALSVLIYWTFERALRRPTVRRMLAFGGVCAIGLFIHYGLLWMIAGLALVVPFRMKPAAWLKWWPAVATAGLAAFVVLVFVALPQFHGMQAIISATPPTLQNILSVAEVKSVANQLWDTARLFANDAGSASILNSITTWLFVAAFLIGAGIALIKPEQRSLLLLLGFPLLVSYVANRFGWYFWGLRYLLFASPLFYLFCGIGLMAVGRRGILLRAVPIIAALALLINQRYIGWPNQNAGEHLRPVMEYMQARRQPEEGIYVYYGAGPAFRVYYADPPEHVKFGAWFRSRPLQEKLADIDSFITSSPRLWFVASHMTPDEVTAILSALDERCQRADTFTQANALAVRYDCRQ